MRTPALLRWLGLGALGGFLAGLVRRRGAKP
ncbi:MAG: hypothetical protein QOK42_787 [Frankiaceae bacterium]|jgi:hypothetical protein|nr:hypothetical protein [Frankiaceae bacterium]MDX6223904.1 hypothetical protein [Frankiales bacterium]MDX6273737.1 hypothetical protein [Frankiales bacterium]